MADWKIPVNYNFNPSFHAYAYGLMYPQGSEQGHPNLSWPEAAYSQTGGVTASYHSGQTTQQSPAWSHENGNANSYGNYPTHTQNGRLFVPYNKTESEPKATDAEQIGSDTPSESGSQTPDSWSSGSTHEGVVLTNLNLPPWKDRDYETDSGSPDSGEPISNAVSIAAEEPVSQNLGVDALPPLPNLAPSSAISSAPSSAISSAISSAPSSAISSAPSSAISSAPSSARPPAQPRKTRAAFSEEQMSALIHRFNVQRYLTPAEMKMLAATTGLTYKQVKTWFQNRRMKLKRHQRDSSWMTERYVVNGLSNTTAAHSQFQTEAPRANQDHYGNPQVRETPFKSPPQTPYYPSYPQPRSPTQATARPLGNWPLPPAVTHYEFPNPTSYVQTRDGCNTVSKGSGPTQMASIPSAAEWSTKEMTLL